MRSWNVMELNPRWWLLLVTLGASCYSMGTIWMTQVSWRLWAYVGRDRFPAYHRAWWFGPRGIQPVVFPFGILATLGSFAQLCWRPQQVPGWMAWLGAALWIATWGSTVAWWGRTQARLEQVRREDGSVDPLYRRLLATHWLRVAFITASALLHVAMTAASLSRTTAYAAERAGIAERAR
jgi:hypothetical protein